MLTMQAHSWGSVPHSGGCTFKLVRFMWSAQLPTDTVQLRKMYSTFATPGLPETLVTNNGSVFTNGEFEDKNRIWHVMRAPFSPNKH